MSIVVTVQSVSQAMEAMKIALKRDKYFVDEQVTISRSEPVNDDVGSAPWVGIYKRRAVFKPRTIPRNWDHDIEFFIWVQHGTLGGSGADAEDALDELTGNVLRVLFSDSTISSMVQMVNEVDVTYSYDEKKGDVYFQHALIAVIGKTRTGFE